MNINILNGLFKPNKQVKKRFVDFLDEKQTRNYYKHNYWHECTKSTDESCANTECKHNHVIEHETDLYVELMQEIQSEKTGAGGWDAIKNY